MSSASAQNYLLAQQSYSSRETIGCSEIRSLPFAFVIGVFIFTFHGWLIGPSTRSSSIMRRMSKRLLDALA